MLGAVDSDEDDEDHEDHEDYEDYEDDNEDKDNKDDEDDEEALVNVLMHDLSQETFATPAHATYSTYRTSWASATWFELTYGNGIAPLVKLYQAVKATPYLEKSQRRRTSYALSFTDCSI
ncbi:hypothetical protein CKAH01_01457 [Colletotrichum kahawae]|uniref:Uncharacterized protein n=1 Tax=Colletotrichum kahawae TaxID=34407 RepID=A0AAD9Y5T1_COLKA|nr:hypothetical protein CKAH01_01457 [Colletotrichum kahawae]